MTNPESQTAAETTRRASARLGELTLQVIQLGVMLDEAGRAAASYRDQAEEAERQRARFYGDLEGFRAVLSQHLAHVEVLLASDSLRTMPLGGQMRAAVEAVNAMRQLLAQPESKDERTPDAP